MNKIRINFNKNIKMHLIACKDDLRPAFEFVYFKNGFMYATDAHILVKNKISECSTFSEEQIAFLENKFLHKDDYKAILKENIVFIENDGFVVKNTGNRKTKYYFAETSLVFPNCDKLFDDSIKSYGSISKIGLNCSLLSIIGKAFPCENNIALFFTKETKATIIRDIDLQNESIALIMPILINND